MKNSEFCFAILVCATCLTLAGCVSTANESKRAPLIPDKTLKLSSSVSVPLEAVAAAAVLFAIIDPLAPNWDVETSVTGPGRFRVTLTMKRFTAGGDGEAYPVLMRAADGLRQTQGAAGYAVTEFSEGIESTVPVARRVARAVVQLR